MGWVGEDPLAVAPSGLTQPTLPPQTLNPCPPPKTPTHPPTDTDLPPPGYPPPKKTNHQTHHTSYPTPRTRYSNMATTLASPPWFQ